MTQQASGGASDKKRTDAARPAAETDAQIRPASTPLYPRWSQERIDIVRALWAEGHSAAQIARVLGDVSRNAIIGIAHRQGFPRRRMRSGECKSIAHKLTAHRASASIEIQLPGSPGENSESRPTEPVAVPGITTANVRDGQCRWPFGDPLTEAFHFCGHPCLPGSPGEQRETQSYCAFHRGIAFIPQMQRRRAAERN